MRRIIAAAAFAFLACAVVAAVQMAQNVDGLLLFVPANILPLGRPLIKGPDLPASLTYTGICAVYVAPALVLAAVAFLVPQTGASRE